VQAFAAAVTRAPIDMVFNVAGVIANASGLGQLAEDLSLADAARTFDTNALGALRVSIALLPAVRKAPPRSSST